MYKHILLPTDGSELSKDAVKACMQLARNTGATVVGVHVIPLVREDLLEAWMHHDSHYAERQKAVYEKLADDYLSFISNDAMAEGVPCVCKVVHEKEPSEGIVKTAVQMRCDLIYMASHGWSDGDAQLLGSETLKVLQASKVPVLVHKERERRD
jgi:nucleotide-binding universal stress UspA family protein